MTRATAILLALATIAAGCNGSGLEAERPAGILSGQITVGPNCPVETEGEACPPPAGTFEEILVLVHARLPRGERLVATVRADDAGRFALSLPAGSYRVALAHSIGIPGAPPAVQEARVEPGATTELTFHVDTGIR
ncbi:hypothetical protein BH20GEM1_BH20GEM1_16270 [soil metagenome]